MTVAERMKFALFSDGLMISEEAKAFIMTPYGERPLTFADYASTSGVSLVLEDDVWVNAPIAAYNPNMVFSPRHHLRVLDGQLFVADLDSGSEVPAWFAPLPEYYDKKNLSGQFYSDFIHTHTDRARLSPIRGCAMRCQFCDIPVEFKGKYYPKPLSSLLEAVACAIGDPIQPASHLLISGGTPAPSEHPYLKAVYHTIATEFPQVDVDVMMVPSPDIVDLKELHRSGVHELSLNIEIWNQSIAGSLMPEKHKIGRQTSLDLIAEAVDIFGKGRVRSMLMVGLEEPIYTLEGVEMLAKLGCTPVLSPFRPSPVTSLAKVRPPSAETMEQVFLEARERAWKYGVKLGPRCIPCSHNTMTLSDGSGDYVYNSRRPNLI